MHIRYAKIRRAMIAEWLTIKQSGSQKCFTKERNALVNEHAWGAPLDLRRPILISPIGTPEKEMANHCGIFAWRISWTEERGRLQSMESQRVRRN